MRPAELMKGPKGFDLSQGHWQDAGWAEMRRLRELLEDCRELSDIVRSLGRAGGRGPLRRAPEEVPLSFLIFPFFGR